MTSPRDAIQFTRESADRIANVVRTLELTPASGTPLDYDPILTSGGKGKLSLATFAGSWSRGTYKTVTIVGSTATASVYNWCNDAAGGTGSTRYVVFGKANGTNSAVEIQLRDTNQTCVMTLAGVDLTAFPGYSAGVIQLLGHSAADMTTNGTACASLTWYSITTCSTAAA